MQAAAPVETSEAGGIARASASPAWRGSDAGNVENLLADKTNHAD